MKDITTDSPSVITIVVTLLIIDFQSWIPENPNTPIKKVNIVRANMIFKGCVPKSAIPNIF